MDNCLSVCLRQFYLYFSSNNYLSARLTNIVLARRPHLIKHYAEKSLESAPVKTIWDFLLSIYRQSVDRFGVVRDA